MQGPATAVVVPQAEARAEREGARQTPESSKIVAAQTDRRLTQVFFSTVGVRRHELLTRIMMRALTG